MSGKSLLALMLVGAVVLFLIGWAAPSPFLSPAVVVLSVPPAQPHERETAVAAPPHCLVDQGQAHPRAGKSGEMPRPSCKVVEQAQLDKVAATYSRVAALLTSPMPPAIPRCEAPQTRCETRAPLPCPEPTRTHILTIANGPRVEQHLFVWRNGAWQSCGE
jgi:hypothetical protein